VEIRAAASLMRPSDEKIIIGSTRKIRKHTGWKPMYTIRQTLTSMLEYWERAL
jgi:GDP-4-dehydro-6-deoxy-D-mannose reductase